MQKKDRLNNFSGTLLFKDVPVVKFTVQDGVYEEFIIIEENRRFLPFLMWEFCSPERIDRFIESRIVPRTRQNLKRVLADLNLTTYSWDGIIKANYGLCTDDCYWFKPNDSTLTYDDIKIRD